MTHQPGRADFPNRIERTVPHSRPRQSPDESWLVVATGDFGRQVIQLLRNATRKNDLRFLHVDDTPDLRTRAAEAVRTQLSLAGSSAPRLMPAIPVLLIGDAVSLRQAAAAIQSLIEQVCPGRDAWCFAMIPGASSGESALSGSDELRKLLSLQAVFELAGRYRRIGRASLENQVELTSHLLRRGLVPVLFEYARRGQRGSAWSRQSAETGIPQSQRMCPVIRLGAAAMWIPDESPRHLAVRMEQLSLVSSSIADGPGEAITVDELLPDSVLDDLGNRTRRSLTPLSNAKLQRLADSGPEDRMLPEQALSDSFLQEQQTRLLERLLNPQALPAVASALSGLITRLEAIASDLEQQAPSVREQYQRAVQDGESLRQSQSPLDFIFRRPRRRRIQKLLKELELLQRSLLVALVSGQICGSILRRTAERIRSTARHLAAWPGHAASITQEIRGLLRPVSTSLISPMNPADFERMFSGLVDKDSLQSVREQYRALWTLAMRDCVYQSAGETESGPDIWHRFHASLRESSEGDRASLSPPRNVPSLSDSLIRSLLRERAEPQSEAGSNGWISREVMLNPPGAVEPVRPRSDGNSAPDSRPADRLPALLWLQIPFAASACRHLGPGLPGVVPSPPRSDDVTNDPAAEQFTGSPPGCTRSEEELRSGRGLAVR